MSHQELVSELESGVIGEKKGHSVAMVTTVGSSWNVTFFLEVNKPRKSKIPYYILQSPVLVCLIL